jgi:phi13 family phage major tail protein
VNIVYGLRNVYYAKLNSQFTPDYNKPVRIPGAVSLSLKSEDNHEIASRSDNNPAIFFNTVHSYNGTLQFTDLPIQFRQDILNEVVENGTVCEPVKYGTNEFALLFELQGNIRQRRYVLYRCRVWYPDIAADTIKNSVDVKGDSLPILALSPLYKNRYIKCYVENTPETADIYNNWFNKVYIPT